MGVLGLVVVVLVVSLLPFHDNNIYKYINNKIYAGDMWDLIV